tara:strand:- start:11 stop:427 length:417 start_codon:yes stop_codon:yes gene_type:complete
MRHPIIRRTASAYSFQGIINAIEAAQNRGLKRIAMRFTDFIVKPSKYQGKVYVFSHNKEVNQWGSLSNIYLGWITENATNLGEVSLIEAVQNAAEDPLAAAQLYGKHTGSCSCCGRELTREDSIAAGIGPICATKFGW